MNIVLSYGLGVDSTALLLRWFEEPASRDFDLSRLLVVTAMTATSGRAPAGELVEEHALPRSVKPASPTPAGRRTYDGPARSGGGQIEGPPLL